MRANSATAEHRDGSAGYILFTVRTLPHFPRPANWIRLERRRAAVPPFHLHIWHGHESDWPVTLLAPDLPFCYLFLSTRSTSSHRLLLRAGVVREGCTNAPLFPLLPFRRKITVAVAIFTRRVNGTFSRSSERFTNRVLSLYSVLLLGWRYLLVVDSAISCPLFIAISLVMLY